MTTKYDGLFSNDLPYYTSNVKAETRIRKVDLVNKPITIPDLLKKTLINLKDEKDTVNALAHQKKIGSIWKFISYQQYYLQIRQFSNALIEIGIKEADAVSIIGFNSIYWHISYMGAIHAGAIAVGLYPTNSEEITMHCIKLSNTRVIVIDDLKYLEKLQKIKESSHDFSIVFCGNDLGSIENCKNVYTWNEFIKLSHNQDEILDERISNLRPNKCASLVFTSGTTGFPKAVMLSHDNMIWTASQFYNEIGEECDREKLISYLPLSHVAAQMLDIIFPIVKSCTVYFAQPTSLKGTLVNTLNEVKPTLFLGVPRVFEKIYEKMKESGAHNSTIKSWIVNYAKYVANDYYTTKMEKSDYSKGMVFGLVNKIVYNKAKYALGLDKCKYIFYGAAPISFNTIDFFMSVGLLLHGVYGLSECSGPHSVMKSGQFHNRTVGVPMKWTETRIGKEDELEISGRHIFIGYKDNDEVNDSVFSENFFKTGDQAKYVKYPNSKDHIQIIGRLKEMVITSGGENVPVVEIENRLKKYIPIVSNAIIIGDNRKFISALLTIKTNVNLETMEPLPELTDSAIAWCQSIGSDSKTIGL
ncbi:hypothetical protein A3Q56_07268 [Intoshia linei]|uniref:long-chain-fatty-acid--CoA ligase n=1 Tax=Intoshia linei TaxID=1819745 RepID=A0A177AUX6_9BILA|nr:hypothetical protein A3Q56_07268 [Intoshia linei]